MKNEKRLEELVYLYEQTVTNKILNKIDYERLAADYATKDKTYAKSILRELHNTAEQIYGTMNFDDYPTCGGDDLILLPGVVHCLISDKMYLALLAIDLNSSGELYDPTFIMESGCVQQSDFENLPIEEKEKLKDFFPYCYGYTAIIPDDIHTELSRQDITIKKMLKEYNNEFTA